MGLPSLLRHSLGVAEREDKRTRRWAPQPQPWGGLTGVMAEGVISLLEMHSALVT